MGTMHHLPSRLAIAGTAAAVALVMTLSACSDATAPTSTSPTPTLATSTAPPSTAQAAPSATADPASSLVDGPTAGLTAFYDAGSSADTAKVALEQAGRAADAATIAAIADQPVSTWLGGWTADPTGTVSATTTAAAQAGQIAVFVVYNIPGRDCGLYSAGGLPEDQYLAWVSSLAAGIAPGSTAWFVLEPDALPQLGDCDGQGDRLALLSGAAKILDEAGGHVFIDAGHSNWQSAATMAERINAVGTEHLAGFATNTSNYNAADLERAWGAQVSAATGLPFVTDTSRNGNGSDGQWCNPRGRALGQAPTVIGADDGLLAVLWTKAPGESDGTCNGGPAAGQWWEEIALELARNAGF